MNSFKGLSQYRYGFSKPENYVFKSKKGLDEKVVANISWHKNEPEWMREFRLKAYQIFLAKKMPTWGGKLSDIDFDDIYYYIKPIQDKTNKWEDLPAEIKDTYDRIGIPEAEKKYLAGVSAQYESESIYNSIQETLTKKGVIFLDMDSGLREYPEIVKKYFGTIIPSADNKFAALNSAVWSGGSFVYIPKGVSVELPLQAYFRINAANMGQFERTLIVAEEGSYVHYVEGCFPAGEQINTRDSWVNIECIKPGDFVPDEQGDLQKVKKIMTRRYRGDMIEITPVSSYNRFRLTPEHPVLTIKRIKTLAKRSKRGNWKQEVNTRLLLDQKPEYIPARDLEEGDFIIFPKIKNTAHSEYSDELLRLLGYYLAEGSAYFHKKLKTYVVSFSLGEDEKGIIEEVKKLIFSLTKKKPMVISDKKKHGVEIRVYSRDLYETCLKECGKGAATKKLSKEIMQLASPKVKELLETYFLGDGNVCVKGKSVMCRAATLSEQLARQLQELLVRLDIYASIQIRKGGEDKILGRTIHRRDQYIIVYTKNKKMGEVHLQDNRFLVPIKKIRRFPFDDFVFNIEVAKTNSYLARGFAVHNCTAPVYSTDSLHSAVVEIIVKPRARVRYTTIQNWSSNVYNLVTKRARVEENGVMEWVDANLGCLTGETELFTGDHIIPIQDITVGSNIYSLNSDLKMVKSKVLAKKTNPPKSVFKVTTEDFHEIEATENHPFLTLSKIGKTFNLSWKPLSELKKGDNIGISGIVNWSGNPYPISFTPNRGLKDFKFPNLTNDNLLWFLGFYLGDGYKDKARVYIAVPRKDRSFQKVIDAVKSLFGLTPEIKGNVVRYNSAKFVDFITNVGFSGNAHTKQVPRWVYGLPQSQITAFINGYIDADGYRRYNHKNISITSVSRDLLGQIKTLAYVTDFQPRKISKWARREKKPLGKEEKTYSHYFLYFGEGKKHTPAQFVKVADIQLIGKKVTYDIEVEKGNFLANGFIVHNSKLTMKYPSVYLMGKGARGEILSIAYAGKGQHQDAGGKAVHVAPYTSSKITSKSISKNGGRTSYRGLLKVYKGAHHVKSKVVCDALLLDPKSRSDTYPTMEIDDKDVRIEHEATVSKVGDEQLFYLQSRGLTKELAESMVVNGFIEPIVKEIPLEYAVEMNRLIQLQMEGSVG